MVPFPGETSMGTGTLSWPPSIGPAWPLRTPYLRVLDSVEGIQHRINVFDTEWATEPSANR